MQLTRTIGLTFSAAGALAAVGSAQTTFQAADTYPLLGQRPDWVAVADFDGANGRDIAVTSGSPQGAAGPDWVEIFVNQGGGTFAPGQQILLGNNVGAAAVVAGDWDGDGDTDLAVSQQNTNNVRILFNTNGVFSMGGVTGVGGSEPRHMDSGDIDGDGDVDLVTSNRDSNNLTLLRNDGGGAFTSAGLVATGAEPRYVVLAPLDGGSSLDLAVAAHDDRRVEVYLNTGAGTFGARQSFPVPGNEKPSGMAARDLDGDGDIDLATTTDNNGLGLVSVFRNNGGGSFTGQNFNTGGVNPGAVFAGDLDGDGDVDLAAADEDANFVSTLPNFGAGTFGAGTSFGVGAHPSHIEGFDLDGNQSIDLVTPNRDSNTISVLINDASGGSLGTHYCGPAAANSTGVAGVIGADGSPAIADNDLILTASSLPAGQFGYFLAGTTEGFFMPPGSQGNICLSGNIGRYNAVSQIISGPAGSLQVDLTAIPVNPTRAAVPSETWRFQCWYRDSNPGSTSNFTDGLRILVQ